MKIDHAGVPFIGGALLVALVLFAIGLLALGVLAVVLTGFFCFFFRDPDRNVPSNPHAVVSAADGRVVYAGEAEPGVSPQGKWKQVSVFLSPLDVHVNRAPVSGRVTKVDYRPGSFFPAYRREAAVENERCEIWIDHNGQDVVCRQVVGVLARRVVCRVTPGSDVALGQRFGIMKFGSRVDIFFPASVPIEVGPGDAVRGGETVLTTLKTATVRSME